MRPATWSEFNPNQIDHLTKLCEELTAALHRQRKTNEGLLAALMAMVEAADGDSDDQDAFYNLLGDAMVQARAAIAAAKAAP